MNLILIALCTSLAVCLGLVLYAWAADQFAAIWHTLRSK